MHSLQRLERLAARGRTLQLSAHPERPDGPEREWFRVQLAAGDADRATVLVYGDIGGWWGVDVEKLVRELHALDVGYLDLHINSQGGSMFDGYALYAALLQHRAYVTAWVDGVAASAASVVLMAGDKRIGEKPSRVMVHEASVYPGSGNKRHLREQAQLLEEFDTDIAEIYADRTGGDAATFTAAMEASTWYSSTAAVEVGLLHEITDRSTKAAPESRSSQLVKARHRARMTLGGVSTT